MFLMDHNRQHNTPYLSSSDKPYSGNTLMSINTKYSRSMARKSCLLNGRNRNHNTKTGSWVWWQNPVFSRILWGGLRLSKVLMWKCKCEGKERRDFTQGCLRKKLHWRDSLSNRGKINTDSFCTNKIIKGPSDCLKLKTIFDWNVAKARGLGIVLLCCVMRVL